jgi:hypothetical protein
MGTPQLTTLTSAHLQMNRFHQSPPLSAQELKIAPELILIRVCRPAKVTVEPQDIMGWFCQGFGFGEINQLTA